MSQYFANPHDIVMIILVVVLGVPHLITFYKEHIREHPRPLDTYTKRAEFTELQSEFRQHKEKERQEALERRRAIYAKMDETRREIEERMEKNHLAIQAELKHGQELDRQERLEIRKALNELTVAVSRHEGTIQSGGGCQS